MNLTFLLAALLVLATLVASQQTIVNPPTPAAPSPQAPEPIAPAPVQPAPVQPAPVQPARPTVSPQPTQTPQASRAPQRPRPAAPPGGQNNNNNNGKNNRPSPSAAAAAPPAGLDIFTYLTRSSNHKVFVNLIGRANLTANFRGFKQVTVFAPTDDAFFLTLRDLRYKMDEDSESLIKFWLMLFSKHKDIFNPTQILPYHVIPSQRRLDYLTSRSVRTAERSIRTFAKIAVELEADGLKDKAVAMPNPNYTLPNNYQASNGIVHSLDRVLFPTNFSRPEVQKIVQGLQEELLGANASSGSVCFPATSRVTLAGGRSVPLSNLLGGHEVVVDHLGTTSRVFLFTHRQHTGYFNFVRLHTGSGRHITLSASHYLLANEKLTAAGSVKLGDMLSTVNGADGKVVFIENVVEKGLVAPHTVHGNIVVDGIVASSYTTAIAPRVARILLAPLRASVRMGLATEPLGSLFYNGADRMAKLLPKGAPTETHF